MFVDMGKDLLKKHVVQKETFVRNHTWKTDVNKVCVCVSDSTMRMEEFGKCVHMNHIWAHILIDQVCLISKILWCFSISHSEYLEFFRVQKLKDIGPG